MSKSTPQRRRTLIELGVTVVALGLLFVGVWQISPPVAWIVVGAVLWIDQTIGNRKP